MAKQFLYCESEPGGMAAWTFTIPPWDVNKTLKQSLFAWRNMSTEKLDRDLLDWIKTAEVGDTFDHRMGVCIRIKDIKEVDDAVQK